MYWPENKLNIRKMAICSHTWSYISESVENQWGLHFSR